MSRRVTLTLTERELDNLLAALELSRAFLRGVRRVDLTTRDAEELETRLRRKRSVHYAAREAEEECRSCAGVGCDHCWRDYDVEPGEARAFHAREDETRRAENR